MQTDEARRNRSNGQTLPPAARTGVRSDRRRSFTPARALYKSQPGKCQSSRCRGESLVNRPKGGACGLPGRSRSQSGENGMTTKQFAALALSFAVWLGVAPPTDAAERFVF